MGRGEGQQDGSSPHCALTLDEMGALIDEAPRDDDGEPEIDFERLASLDAGFHLGIAVAAGNKFLRQTAGVLHDMLLAGMETTLNIPGRVGVRPGVITNASTPRWPPVSPLPRAVRPGRTSGPRTRLRTGG